MTPREAADIISLGQLSGLEPDASIAGSLVGAAKVYARVLTLAGVDYPMAEAAMLEIVSEPWRSEYRRKLPTTGEIIARTPVGRTSTAIGTASDAERAFADFQIRLRWCIGMNVRPDRDGAQLDPADPYRNDAMFQAWATYPRGPAAPDEREKPFEFDQARKRWIAAYLEARHGQARDPAAVQSTLALAQQALLTGPAGAQ